MALILMLLVGAMATNWVREGGLSRLLGNGQTAQTDFPNTAAPPADNVALPPNAMTSANATDKAK